MHADVRRRSSAWIGVHRRFPTLGGMRSARYVHLVDTKFTKWSNFVREAWLIKEKWNKRSCLKPPMNADARRCSAPLIGVHRRFPTLGGMRSSRYVLGARKVHKSVKFAYGPWHGRPARESEYPRWSWPGRPCHISPVKASAV